MLNQVRAVAIRVLRQLLHDRRFLALSALVPVVIIYMLYLFFDATRRPFFNPKEFVPAVGAFVVHFITYILCAVVLVRERTQQTMTRMFVSGYERAGIIGGYVGAYSVIATIQSLVVLVALNQLFDLAYDTTAFIKMYAVIWLLAIISIALGIFVSNFARTEGQVLPMIPLILMPSIFFSGMIVDVHLMPDWVEWLSFSTPMFYANQAIDAIRTGAGLQQTGELALYGIVVMSLAIITLREQNSAL